MKNNSRISRTIAVLALLTTGCTGEKDADLRSIEEIHRQEGVPVRVRELQPGRFNTHLNYTSTLSGAEESTASAMIEDVVEEVLVKVGDYVEKDQVVLTFPQDNSALNYEQARVNFESAKTSFQRISTLYAEEGVSRQSLDNARTQYEIARANWETVQNLRSVKSPLAGFVTRLNVLESDNVEPGDPLFTVSVYDQLKSTVWVTDREIDRLAVGQQASADWRGHHLEGKVIQVDMGMDQTHKAFAVKLEFDNSAHTVRSGVSASIRIMICANEAALVVDMNEIIESGDKSYVFLADSGTSRRQEIRTGCQEGLKLEVLEGLHPGDKLITEGVNQVTDGGKIRIIADDNDLAKR